MEIRVRGEITAEDYVRAKQLEMRPRRLYLVLGLALVLFWIALGLDLPMDSRSMSEGVNALGALGAMALLVYFRLEFSEPRYWRFKFSFSCSSTRALMRPSTRSALSLEWNANPSSSCGRVRA